MNQVCAMGEPLWNSMMGINKETQKAAAREAAEAQRLEADAEAAEAQRLKAEAEAAEAEKQRLEKAAEQRLKADAKKQKAAPAPESEMNVNMLKTQIEKLNEIAAQLISEGKQLTQQQEKEMENLTTLYNAARQQNEENAAGAAVQQFQAGGG